MAAARWPRAIRSGSAAKPRAATCRRWRARAGAILTGAGTVLIDDPQLTVRLGDDTPFVPPLRVVLDPGLATVRAATSAKAARRRCTSMRPMRACRAASKRDHAPCRCTRGASISRRCCKLLAAREINEVQVEAGATLAGAFLAAGLVDELLLYVAPVMLGERARPMFDGLPIDAMTERLRMRSSKRAASAPTCAC
jgi:diaminohydroxyphosphoribosylaminopyrimidine deaminase/5-amino-6-(5-phosphoribosylamino)uracil reductase